MFNSVHLAFNDFSVTFAITLFLLALNIDVMSHANTCAVEQSPSSGSPQQSSGDWPSPLACTISGCLVPLNWSQSSKSTSWMQLMELYCKQEYKESTTYGEAPSNRPHLKKITGLPETNRVRAEAKQQYSIAGRNCKQPCLQSVQKM
jgi:hypothetical protein